MKAALQAINVALLVIAVAAVAVFFLDRAVFGPNAPGLFS
jgi:hypothetical protein